MSTVKKAEAMIEAVDRIVRSRGARRTSVEFVNVIDGQAIFCIREHPTEPVGHAVPELVGHWGTVTPTDDGWEATVKSRTGAPGSIPIAVRT